MQGRDEKAFTGNSLLTKAQTDHILHGHPVNQNTVTVQYKSEGPAAFDPWMGLINNDPNPWLHTEQAAHVNGRKEKIIICEPIEGFRPVNAFTYVFINSLFEFYEVYFWNGPEGQMRLQEPLPSSIAFWQGKREAKVGTEAAVKQSLANEGLRPQDYLILDFHRFADILHRNIEPIDLTEKHRFVRYEELEQLASQNKTTLDLRWLSRDWRECLQGIHPEKIQTLIMQPESAATLRDLFQAFPNVDTVEVENPSTQWIQHHLTWFNGKSLTLNLENIPTKKLVFSLNMHLKRLSIFHRDAHEIDYVMGPLFKVPVLIIRGHSSITLNLTKNDHVHDLAINGYHGIRLLTAKSSPLTSLSLEYLSRDVNIPFSKLNALETLNIDYIPKGIIPPLPFGVSRLSVLLACLCGKKMVDNSLPALKQLTLGNHKNPLDLRYRPSPMEAHLKDLKKVMWEVLDEPGRPLVQVMQRLPEPVKKANYSLCISRGFYPKGGFLLGSLRIKHEPHVKINGWIDVCVEGFTSVDETSQLLHLSKHIDSREAPVYLERHDDVLPPDALSVRLNYGWRYSVKSYCLSSPMKSNLTKLKLVTKQFEVIEIDLANFPDLLELDVDAGRHEVHLKNVSSATKLKTVRLVAANSQASVKYALPPHCSVYIKETEKAHYKTDDTLFKCPTIKSPMEVINEHPRLRSALEKVGIGFGALAGTAVLGGLVYLFYSLFDGIGPSPSPTPTPPAPPLPPAPVPVVSSEENHDMDYVYGAAGVVVLGLLVVAFFSREQLGVLLRGLVQSVAYDDDFDIEGGLVERKPGRDPGHVVRYEAFANPSIMVQPDRVRVKSGIALKHKKIVFYSNEKNLERVDVLPHVENEGYLNAMRDEVREDASLALYGFRGKMKAGRYYPMPVRDAVLNKDDILEVVASLPGLLEVYFSAENQVPYLRLKRGGAWVEVHVKVRHAALHLQEENPVLFVGGANLLDEKIKTFITQVIKANDALHFMLDDGLAPLEKLTQLSRFLEGMQATEDKQVKPLDLSTLTTAIQQGSLSRMNAYRLLVLFAQYLSVPAVLVSSSTQLYAELPYSTDQGRCLRPHYLGGEALVLAAAPQPDKKDEKSSTILSRFTELWNAPTQKQLAEQAKYRAWVEEVKSGYRENLLALVERQVFTGPRALVQAVHHKLTPLLVLDPALSVSDFHQSMVYQLQSEAHYYIHSFRDLVLAFKTNCIRDGVLLRNQPGILAQLFKQNHDYFFLLFNLDAFSAEELAKIHSCFDERQLSLHGEVIHIPSFVQFICTTHAPENLDEAFLSRTLPFTVHKGWGRSLSPAVGENPVEIDLFELPAWRERVFGEINFVNGRLKVEEGALYKAIHENRTLVLQNVPEDESLTLLIHQVNVERRVMMNGEIVLVPNDCYVMTATKEHLIDREVVAWLSPEEVASRHCVDVGLHNFYEATQKRLFSDAEARPHTVESMLQTFDPRRSVIRIVSVLPRTYFEYLLHYLQSAHPGQPISLSLAPNVHVEGLDLPLVQPVSPSPFLSEAAAHQSLFATTDLEWLTETLAATMSDPDIIHLHPQTTVQDLLVSVVLAPEETALFTSRPQGLLKAIRNKTAVILVGEPSVSLFHHLQTLFESEPYLDYEGDRIQLKAPVKLIFPSHKRLDYPRCDAEFNPNWDDYELALRGHPAYTPLRLQGIKKAIAAISKYPHAGRGRPAPFEPNYHWIKNLLLALNEVNASHRSNKLKAWVSYHYPRHLEIQAYVNVVLKYYLGVVGDEGHAYDRLSQRLSSYDLSDAIKFKTMQWRVLSTFPRDVIVNLIGDSWDEALDYLTTPSLKTDRLMILIERARHEHSSGVAPSLFRLPHYKFEKQQAQLEAFITHPAKRIAFIKGSPGVSKTYSIKRLKSNPDILFCDGETALFAALSQTNTGQLVVCLIDEANMRQPGTLDYLVTAIGCSKNKVTLPSGESYPLPWELKLLLSGNPEDFVDRYYHSAIMHHAEIIYFDDPNDDALLSLIAKENMPPIEHALMRELIRAFRLVNTYHVHFHGSIRDVLSLKHRYDMLLQSGYSAKLAAFRACEGEFAASIPDAIKRKQYLDEVGGYFDVKDGLHLLSDDLVRVTNDFYLPREKYYLVEALQQALALRLQYLIAKEKSQLSPQMVSSYQAHLLKPLIVLQGDSGVGKSSFQRAIVAMFREKMVLRLAEIFSDPALHRAEINVLTREIMKEPVCFSMSDADLAKTLERAYENEAIVISDEVNVNPAIERLMISLLERGHNAFLFLGSQNGTGYRDRVEASPALVNREQVLHFDNYTKAELVAIARHFRVPEPELLVEVYESVKKDHAALNMRTFYTLLKSGVWRQVELSAVNEMKNMVGLPLAHSDSSGSAEQRPLLMHRH